MKKINNEKLERIKKTHLKYCKSLFPKKMISEDLCKLLCCENPFDFSVINPPNPKCKYLKKKYWKYVTSDQYDYSKFYNSFRTPSAAPKRNINWHGIKLLEALDISVCPYCGINYI